MMTWPIHPKKFTYKKSPYLIRSLSDAVTERKRRVAAGGTDICIISCWVYGGDLGDYIIVVAQRPEGGKENGQD